MAESKLPSIQINTNDNPVFSPSANYFSEIENFKKDSIISFYNNKIKKIEISEQKEPKKIEQTKKQFTKTHHNSHIHLSTF